MSGNAIVIGLTGNIACGKSLVVKMLRELGAEVLDADKLAHESMVKGTDVWKKVIEEFGSGILNEVGEIDRPKLGAIVFSDPSALRRLEEIVHPVVIARTIQLARESKAPAFVIEAIKLIEAGLIPYCDTLWVVTCRAEQQLERLVRDRNLSPEAALTRMEAQPPVEEKLRVAAEETWKYPPTIIDNSGTREATSQQVRKAWNHLMGRS